MLHHKDGARFLPDVTLGIQAKEFNLGFIRPENLVSHGQSFRCLLANSNWAVVPFAEKWLLSGLSNIKARLVSFSKVFLSPQRNSGALSE